MMARRRWMKRIEEDERLRAVVCFVEGFPRARAVSLYRCAFMVRELLLKGETVVTLGGLPPPRRL